MIAYLISAHTDPMQLEQLVQALPEDSFIFIHIDLKSDISLFTNVIKDGRVKFIKHRCNVVWGSIVEVEYQMELVRAALAENKNFDFLVTLSGLDYPVWSRSEMKSFFDKSRSKELICGNDISWQTEVARGYREYRLFADRPFKYGSIGSKCRVALRRMMTAIGIKKPLEFVAKGRRYKLYKGAAWWAISEGLARRILNEWDTNEELVRYFSTSFCPAETFAQTVAFNSPEFRTRCLLTEGEYPGLAPLTPLTYINYNPVIKILTESDYEEIKNSGKMFARKLVTGKSEKLIEMIQRGNL